MPVKGSREVRARVVVLFGNIPMWGQERANIEVYDVLKSRGIDSLFVTHREWGHEHVQPALEARGLAWTTASYVGRLERGMGVRRWISSLRTMAKASLELRRIIRDYAADGLHVANPVHFLNFAPALLTTRLPLVYRLGDSPATRHVLYRLLWKRLIAPRVTCFVCDSRFIQRQLLDLGVPVERTVVVYPPPPARRAVQPGRFPCEAGVFTAVFVGQLSPHKGMHLAVEAVGRLRRRGVSIRLLVAGDYSWQNPYARDIMDRVAAQGLQDAIQFLGHVEDVPGLLACAHVHLCPTLSEEPLGLVVVEAKQAARPSIVFPSGGLIELVSHEADGYVCPEKTVDALQAALMRYVNDPNSCVEQGRRARESLDKLDVFGLPARWEQVWMDAIRGAPVSRGTRAGAKTRNA